jgi:hypothetical protein
MEEEKMGRIGFLRGLCWVLFVAGVLTEGARGQQQDLQQNQQQDQQQDIAIPGSDNERAGDGSGEAGYIDSARPQTMFRLRYDTADRINRPDRAEFFYPKYGAFRNNPGPTGIGALFDPRAPGPAEADTRVDYKDIAAYLEWAPSSCLSGFVELPYRFLLPDQNEHTSGIADMNAGFKWAFLNEPDQVATFQLRTYLPTGDSFRGLGAHHVSLEPALLYYQQLTDRWKLEGEFRDWIPIEGTNFQGNVIRYGIGVSYLAYNHCHWRLAPIVELVGWTVLDGQETSRPISATEEMTFAGLAPHVLNAGGDTIINVHVGARLDIGEHSDFYMGYGRALTNDRWYQDILRLEYRLRF